MAPTTLAKANTAFRERRYDDARALYEEFASSVNEGRHFTPTTLYEYAVAQIRHLDRLRTGGTAAPETKNIVLTSANAKYFPSLLLLIQSIFTISYDTVDEILVYDLGLEAWQSDIIRRMSKVGIFSYPTGRPQDPRLDRFKPDDPSTYFFKVYAFHFWRAHSRFASLDDVNLLWIDSGIEVQHDLSAVFQLVAHDGCFFVDHSDVRLYYKDAQELVVNILSPALEQCTAHYRKLTGAQMLRPYIKANFFGLRTGGSYAYLAKQHLDFCLDTGVLFDPRNINSKQLSDHWLRTTDVEAEIKRQGLTNSGRYLFGRHEQAVWSYLVARDDIPIHSTLPYNYTVAPGSGALTATNWEKVMRPKLSGRYDALKGDMKRFIEEAQPPVDATSVDLEDKNRTIAAYLAAGKAVYITEPVYTNVGFPRPAWSGAATVLLHRGSAARTDQHKFAGRALNRYANIRDDIFVLLGNGPSLGDVDLRSLTKYDTFGLNAAYRAYPRVDFWPKYFGCFDALVCSHHAAEFKRLIKDSPIEKFFFINFDDQGAQIFPESEIRANPRFQNIDFRYRGPGDRDRLDILSGSFTPFTDMRTSGSNSIQAGLLMGYRKFVLLGVDQNYVEVVDGAARDKTFHKLVMKETPKENPNYWFADYQVQGDKFNRPNLQGTQIPAWNNLSLTLENLGLQVEIYNCSPITQLDCFRKATLEQALADLTSVKAANLPPFRSTLNRATV
ncbi:MAG: hypothetical protein IV094_06575 [Vitreoscilla sp.]|nr:hypothetical protein [Vitreoscilla sp.]